MKAKLFVIALALSFTSVLAQSDASDSARAAVAAVYETSASIGTNISGVRTFPEAPKGFDVVRASDAELARYGYPPRPSATGDPDHYAQWVRAMQAAKIRWNGKLRDMGAYSMPAKLGKTVEPAASGVPRVTGSSNWSGIVNTNALKTWNSKTSIYYVISSFNVPVAEQAFGVCDGGYDWEVSWNGIDGFSNGDVLQGGSSSQAFCSGGVLTPSYCGWVEWYPSYPILCEFGVNPGDDFYVETYSPSGGFNDGFVFIEDETTLSYGTYVLGYISGPPLVGNSAEYIVERPGSFFGLYPLANYVWNFWAGSLAVDFNHYHSGLPTQYFPGSASTATWLVNMYDDAFDQVISVPAAQGKYGMFMQDTGCAYTGGCVP
jgi:hypothetical protein